MRPPQPVIQSWQNGSEMRTEGTATGPRGQWESSADAPLLVSRALHFTSFSCALNWRLGADDLAGHRGRGIRRSIVEICWRCSHHQMRVLVGMYYGMSHPSRRSGGKRGSDRQRTSEEAREFKSRISAAWAAAEAARARQMATGFAYRVRLQGPRAPGHGPQAPRAGCFE